LDHANNTYNSQGNLVFWCQRSRQN